MKEDVISLEVPFLRVRRGLGVGFQEAGDDLMDGEPTPMALYLAKAHALDRLLTAEGDGALSRVAKQWGVSRPRVAQLHGLIYLAPDLQMKVLKGSAEASRLNFHSLLSIARHSNWIDQRDIWSDGSSLKSPTNSGHGGKPVAGSW